ncbi:Tetratricopeptide TPR_1 repeat-containing protein [Stanieria cyanosphaera PCC 7437]|uniref:Tetratricopeptide TPR_1 repeat-containing protein n=1 Tax=Stanieria cyanosphaera (strain ATCC 29371 / PCC 7437) TaxID=111780 RepID=K9XRZ8_STAC7|nr:tetratricopeptide repeat protein [Stanieria cyanosphaera]AFZ34831.1 Tetratricopeptide TPR_1 repeat-containing protein [Stanieria cyanosphaera PCC 7437]
MNLDTALASVDQMIYAKTGKHLSNLQTIILKKVWQGKKYLAIADEYGCTEGHVKDVASWLWKILSEVLQEKVTKTNFRTVIQRKLSSVAITKSSLLSSGSAYFIGRDHELAYLQTLVDRGSKVIMIQGEGGVGKTTLAQHFLLSQGFSLVLEVLMAKETQNITSVESIVEEWLQRDLHEEAGNEFGVTLARLKRCLEQQKIGILIDNLEPALDREGKFIAAHRNYVELLRVLSDLKIKSITLVTSRDRICEADLNLEHYRLPGLSLSAWQEFFFYRQILTDSIILAKLHQTYGGNAKAMGIVAGVIQEDYAGNIDNYWQENANDPLVEINLKNLVAHQFDRLQKLDEQAYLLLCRLGCYRYQDIPQISRSGLLILLWDVEEKHKRKIIESLRNRSLVEFSQAKYWLHPVIKAEAILRLQRQKEWQQTHLTIAQFYTASVTKINSIQDGLTALEAYYHYVAIEDFDAAGQVIINSYNNQWGQYLTLGSTLYRLGLIQPLLTAITQIIEKISTIEKRSELNNILGDLYWISGQIYQAIACQKVTISAATQCLKNLTELEINQYRIYYLKMLQVDSLLSLGLYQIDLLELDQAANFFQQVINLAYQTRHHSWAEKASICLDLVNSARQQMQVDYQTSQKFYQLIIINNDPDYNTGRFAFFIQILGQTHLNLGETTKAQQLFTRAIAFSQSSNYTQIKAKALSGLAVSYRQINQFETAEQYHQQAINLLDNLGAKCDLAEAYFQWGLTLQISGKSEVSKNNFERASQLFQQINAPKQLVKIRNQLE